jgi:hypothetical protein
MTTPLLLSVLSTLTAACLLTGRRCGGHLGHCLLIGDRRPDYARGVHNQLRPTPSTSASRWGLDARRARTPTMFLSRAREHPGSGRSSEDSASRSRSAARGRSRLAAEPGEGCAWRTGAGSSPAPPPPRGTSGVRGDTTLASQPSGDMRESSQPPPPESAPLTGRHYTPRMTLSSRMTPAVL